MKRTMTARAFGLVLSVLLPMTASAQRVLTLDSCRAMALRNNKQMGVARVQQEVNANLEPLGFAACPSKNFLLLRYL